MSQSSTQTKPEQKLVIRPIRCECTGKRYCQLCEAIERLGGVKCQDGFVFRTNRERCMAAELLGDRFGTRFFELL